MKPGSKPLAQCLRCTRHDRITLPLRCFSTSTPNQQETEVVSSMRPPLDPFTAVTPREERKLMREQSKAPIGSRRRRAAMLSSPNIPFVELPYQCFQEARKVLRDDRNEKLEMIRVQRERIAKLQAQLSGNNNSGQQLGQAQETQMKMHQLKSMRRHLEHLKILADSNDPLVKKRFEDGQGDMNKPIYRFYADKEWRSYKRKILMQRIEQMNFVPDVLPKIDPTVATSLSFPPPPDAGRRPRVVQHGDFVDSRVSEYAPNLEIQRFQKGMKLYTIAVINPDVPNVAKDGFDYRCHFLACNIPISPTQTSVKFSELGHAQVVLPWLPAYAQKGAPYQRMSIVIFEQPAVEPQDPVGGEEPESQHLNVSEVRDYGSGRFTKREDFILRSFADVFGLKPVGMDLFRTLWDEGTAGVMERAGIVGSDVEFKRKRIEPLPYKRLKEERYR